MSTDRWIVVRNWERFQHPDVTRSDSPPPWIRNYTQLLHDEAYLSLTSHQRGILHGLWLEYASARRQLRDNTASVTRRLGVRVTRATLDALNHAGFIEFSASKPQAERKQLASLDKRRIENPPYPPSGKTAKSPNGRARISEEEPSMIDVVTACNRFIEGLGWDETFDETAIITEFHRIERGRRTEGKLDKAVIGELLDRWYRRRQERYDTPEKENA